MFIVILCIKICKSYQTRLTTNLNDNYRYAPWYGKRSGCFLNTKRRIILKLKKAGRKETTGLASSLFIRVAGKPLTINDLTKEN